MLMDKTPHKKAPFDKLDEKGRSNNLLLTGGQSD
jgi:hypothetical protein